MHLRTLTPLFLLILASWSNCTDTGDHPCSPQTNCHRNDDGEATCMPGFVWEDPNDSNNFNCVVPTTIDDPTSPDADNTENTDNDNNGCPSNSTWQNDGCYCDEGYVVNNEQTGCIEGTSTNGNCPPNSSWQDDGCYCNEGFVLNDAGSACVLECTADTDCQGGEVCLENACRIPPCTPGSCETGLVCDETSGLCINDLGTLPAQPNLQCNVLPAENCADTDLSCIPDWQCTGSHCGQLTTFDPRVGDHYDDYPINGETASDQYRSFIREDVLRLVKYASAWVRCMSSPWNFGNGKELGLGDMSEADGAIPGASRNSPGHPQGTHTNGHDMDIGYFQLNTSNNYLRSVCDHTTGNEDQNHCVGEPTNFDVWRTAIVLAKMHDSPHLRVIGVDGKIGPLVESAITQMCSQGWLSGPACTQQKITYEVTDNGYGWYRFHHHHFHISISGSKRELPYETSPCLNPTCTYDYRQDPRHHLYPRLLAPLKEH